MFNDGTGVYSTKKDNLNLNFKDTYKDNYNNNTNTNPNFMQQTNKTNFLEDELRDKNKRINDLSDENISLRGNIEILKNNLSNMEGYKTQIENLKKQKSILEDKIKIYENESIEKSNTFTDQLKNFSEAENYLKNQLNNKEKMIMNLENVIREKDGHNKKLQDFLKTKETTFEEFNNNNKNNILKLDKKDEEIKRLNEDLEQNEKGKKKVEEKMKELIGIIKQQAKELTDLEQQSQLLDKDRKSLIQSESQHLLEVEKWKGKFIDLKDKVKETNELRLKMQENESVIKEMNSIIEVERTKNNKLLALNKEINNEFNALIQKYSGENSLENLQQEISVLKKENNNLKVSVDNLLKGKDINVQLENLIKEIIGGVNSELGAVIQWVETYFGNFYNSESFEVPNIPVTVNKVIKSKIKINQLKECLQNKRKKVNEEQQKFEQYIQITKNDINNFNSKIENYMETNSNLQNTIMERNEDINQLNYIIDNLNRDIKNLKETIDDIRANDNKEEIFNKFYEKMNFDIITLLDKIQNNKALKKINDILNNYNLNPFDSKQSLEQNIDKLLQYVQAIVSEFEFVSNKPDDITKSKIEIAKLNREVSDLKKNHKLDIDKLLRERDEMIKNYDNLKNNDITKLEHNLKITLEKMKNNVKSKQEELNEVMQENNLLKTQLKFLENSLNNYKSYNQENSYDFKDKCETLEKAYKDLDSQNKVLTRELELRTIKINQLECNLLSKDDELKEIESDTNNIRGKLIHYDKIKNSNLELTKINNNLTSQLSSIKYNNENTIDKKKYDELLDKFNTLSDNYSELCRKSSKLKDEEVNEKRFRSIDNKMNKASNRTNKNH